MEKVFARNSIPFGVLILCLVFLASMVAMPAMAQVRGIAAGALVLDDYKGHTLILQTPEAGDPSYSTWISGGPLYLRLPLPPTSGAEMGFVMTGPATSSSPEVLIWDPPASGGGTGGVQGVWRSQSLATEIGSIGIVAGTGTSGTIPVWNGTGTSLGNSPISVNGSALTFGGYGTGVLHSNATGGIASSPVELNAGLTEVTGTLPAANGGTGQSGYTTGDMLFASDASTVSKLNIGATAQVLAVSASGVPAWANNGATITQATNTPVSLTTSASNYTINSAATYIRLTNTAAGTINITGINSSGVQDGRQITLVNVGTQPIQITNLDGSSNAADQFDLPDGPVFLGPKGSATFLYDQALLKWELFGNN
jgi:hypothetical protein